MTPLQLAVLDQVREMVASVGVGPTIGSLARLQRLPEHRARAAIEALIDEGYLQRRDDARRALTLVDLAADPRPVPTEALRAELARRGETIEALKPRPLAAQGTRPCAVAECGERVKPGHLMCRDHWLAIPQEIRGRIWAGYRARDQRSYGAAYQEAIDFLAERDRELRARAKGELVDV